MPHEIGRIGRTIAVEIPGELLQRAGLEVGDAVEWRLLESGSLELRPATGEEPIIDDESGRWAQILAQLTASRDAEDETPEEPDWTLTFGTEYKKPHPDSES